jgi:hypothetical protein
MFVPAANEMPESVTVAAVRDDRIVALYGVLNPEKLRTLRQTPDP